MVLIDKNQSWPEFIGFDPSDQFRKPMLRPLRDVVAEGINAWAMRTPIAPTHLVINHSLRNKMVDDFSIFSSVCNREIHDEFFGLKVLYSPHVGVELLGDCQD